MAAGAPASSPSMNPSGAAAAKQDASPKPGFHPSAAAQSTASATSSGDMVRTRNESSFIQVRMRDQCNRFNLEGRANALNQRLLYRRKRTLIERVGIPG